MEITFRCKKSGKEKEEGRWRSCCHFGEIATRRPRQATGDMTRTDWGPSDGCLADIIMMPRNLISYPPTTRWSSPPDDVHCAGWHVVHRYASQAPTDRQEEASIHTGRMNVRVELGKFHISLISMGVCQIFHCYQCLAHRCYG